MVPNGTDIVFVARSPLQPIVHLGTIDKLTNICQD